MSSVQRADRLVLVRSGVVWYLAIESLPMPELPEVELAARSLRQWLIGRRVTAVTVMDAKLAGPEAAREWSAALEGQECESVERRAKYLLAPFTGGHTLLAHLRMTGRFV